MKARLLKEENRKWWTLAAVSFGLFMIMLDNTVVNVALPSIQSDLGLKVSQLEWVVAGYALTFGLLLVPAGRFGDARGRRAAFLLGLVPTWLVMQTKVWTMSRRLEALERNTALAPVAFDSPRDSEAESPENAI